jgi:hypothetical protein
MSSNVMLSMTAVRMMKERLINFVRATTTTGSPQLRHTPTPTSRAQAHEFQQTRSSKRHHRDDAGFDVESDCDWDEDDGIPLIYRIMYCVPVSKAQVGHNATPAPASKMRQNHRLLDQIHGLKLKLTRSNKTAADKVRCTQKLNTMTTEKERHIDIPNERVQALQAQIAILQRKNNNLYVAATVTKVEHASAVHKHKSNTAREDEQKNEKENKASLHRRLLSYGAGHGK